MTGFEYKHQWTEKDYENFSKTSTHIGLMKKITKIVGHVNVERYIETHYKNDLLKCAWCGSLCKFFKYVFELKDDVIYIVIKASPFLRYCGRTDTEVTRQCECKRLNRNSITYVQKTMNFKTRKQANDFILSRSKSPFYRNNHATEELYKISQTRDVNYYGEERYKHVCDKIKKSLSRDVMVAKHGVAKYETIQKSKDSMSVNFHKSKYGTSWEQELYHRRSKCKSNGSDFYISKYGETEGIAKFNIRMKQQILAKKEYTEMLTDAERREKWDTSSKEYFRAKYGQNWELNYKESVIKKTVGYGKASKESLVFFEPIVEHAKSNNIPFYIGDVGSQEWFIYDAERCKISFYDLCLPTLKIILEYHGSLWHFNPDCEYNKSLPFSLTVEANKQKDEYKRNLAIKHGFEIIETFDTSNKEKKYTEIFELIQTKVENLI